MIDTYLLCGGSRKDSQKLKEADPEKSLKKKEQLKQFKWIKEKLKVFSK
jgi:hypothetical protein